MATKEKHPSIEKFKDFVKRHPKLAQEVRTNNKTWQEIFEEWYLIGEEDDSWKSFQDGDISKEEETEKKSKTDVIPQILQSLKKMDMNQMQYHLTNVNSAIGNIQQLIQQFIPNTSKGSTPSQGAKSPFSFRKD